MLELLQRLASGDKDAQEPVVQELSGHNDPTRPLLEAAVTQAGSPRAREVCDRFLADPNWPKAMPLWCLEFNAVLPGRLDIAVALEREFLASGWAKRHLEALRGDSAPEAARALVAELNAVAEQAADLVNLLQEMRKRIDPPLHILQVQALTRAEWALGSLKGRKVLEVGAQTGGLFLELIRLGANALAVDIEPMLNRPDVLKGDFMTTELPGPFDLIVATAVFELGSSTKGEADGDRNGLFAVPLLNRFRALTQPGGVVVLENIRYAIPFTEEDAREAGFEVLPHRLPSVNLASGGRGCTLRRR